IMRVITVILLLGCLHLSASTRSQTISLHARNEPLSKIFDEITRQTDYLVVYSDRITRGALPVSVSVRNMPLEAFLAEVTQPQGLTYSIQKNTVLITQAKRGRPDRLAPPLSVRPVQQRRITGTVTDHLGKPFPGV